MAFMAEGAPNQPRFIADAMLGRLARWLRLLGWDTLYNPRWEDNLLASLSLREGRVLLTRDRALFSRKLAPAPVFIESDHLGDQLRQTLATLRLEPQPERIFTRCSVCNALVLPATPQEVAGIVPPFVLRHHDQFRRCPDCLRVYWSGTHRRLALERLSRLITP